ncbi:hypothetical protein V6N13_063065 [Hibiscus sabdariffa]|uniref:Uncharacterized protein n=1 Tax=Hibiscus sabdariffa TaxID=183260 RepID=A0ABR2C420_9ROSI
MHLIALGIGAWAVNTAIDEGFIIGKSHIYFPIGNAATGFFVTFAMLAAAVGLASMIAGINHICLWNAGSLPSAALMAGLAWIFTLLATGSASC